MTETRTEPETAAAVLVAVRSETAVADRAEVAKLQLGGEWAAMHSVDSIQHPATLGTRWGDTGIPVAGPGAPWVAEFSVAEFAAAIGLPTEAGKRYLGEAVELRHRLPRLWARTLTGDLPAWRARRIAAETLALSEDAAAFVDTHVAHVAHKIRLAQLDRLVEEAIGRFMPEEVERRRRDAAEGRSFTIDQQQISFQGTSKVYGELDLADALDLDAAVSAGAEQLKALGSTDSLDVRRAAAAGQLARRQLALDLNTDTQTGAGTVAEESDDGHLDPLARRQAGPARRATRKPRQVVLYLHLADAALTNHGIGRLENTRSMVTVEQIRIWCGNPDTQVTIKPVIDLNDHLHVDAYEVPDRMAEAATLIDHTCVFPWCTRPARGCAPDEHDADCDHIDPYDSGGPTCSCNIAPLCRRHHRWKTHSAWSYTPLERGTYLWTSPHGYQYLRNHQGTLDVSRDRPPRP
jgi:hypothetical protein